MQNFGENNFYTTIRKVLEYDISDIHVREDNSIYVRDSSGEIKELQDVVISQDEIYGFLHDILPTENIDAMLEGTEMDAAYTIDDIRFRINAYQDNNGIRLALRKISSNPPSMDEIGLGENIKNKLMADKGLILVTGATGSGKSTSLASMVDYINENKKAHILTLEDPVEFVYENKNSLVTQRQIGRNSKSWNDAIKYSLRQDPDVVLVGEMRDLESISSVLTLVETGHLVLSSLHTVDAIQTISRIIDVFPSSQQAQIATQLSLSLEMIVSQRLIPTKDYNGRVAAREVLMNTNAVANNIRDRKLPQLMGIMETSGRYGMKTMDQSLAQLVVQGYLDPNSILPKVKNIEGFKNLLQYYKNEQKQFNPVD